MPVEIIAPAAGAFGLIVGSFLNVVAYRLPRGESLARPGSRCPDCGVGVRPYDNVPVLSWLLLRGRCRSCGTAISRRYPLVEGATGVLAALIVLDKGVGHGIWLALALLALLVPISLIDLERRIIPNKLTGPGALVAVVIGLAVDPHQVPEQLIAGAAAGGFLLVTLLAYPAGMGMGDVKLAGMLGLFLGREVAVAMLVALLAGSVVGGVIIARKGAAEGRKTAVPFGPFLALGGLTAIFAGPQVIDWYLRSFT